MAFVLTGCLNVTGNVTIASDASVSGTLGIALDKTMANTLGITNPDDLIAAMNDQAQGGDLTSFNCASWAGGETSTDYTATCTFEHKAMTDPAGPFTVSVSDDTITLHAVNKGSDLGNDSPLPAGASIGSMLITAHFPGSILSISPGVTKVDETTATFGGPVEKSFDQTITSKTSGGGGPIGGSVLDFLVAGAALVLLAAIVVAVIAVVLSRRRKAPVSDDPSTWAPPTTTTFGTGPSMQDWAPPTTPPAHQRPEE